MRQNYLTTKNFLEITLHTSLKKQMCLLEGNLKLWINSLWLKYLHILIHVYLQGSYYEYNVRCYRHKNSLGYKWSNHNSNVCAGDLEI